MNFIKFVVQGIFIYVIYRLVVNFILPVFRGLSRFRKNMDHMQNQMKEEQQKQFNHNQNNAQGPAKSIVPEDEGEYIEFEEIK